EQERVLAQQRIDLAGLVVGVFLLDVLRYQAGHSVQQIGLKHALVVDDLHGATAQHIRGAHNERKAELRGDGARLLDRIGNAIPGLLEVQLVEQFLEAVAILRKVDGVGGSSQDRD